MYIFHFHWEQCHKHLSNFQVIFPLQFEIYHNKFEVFHQSLLMLGEQSRRIVFINKRDLVIFYISLDNDFALPINFYLFF